MSKKRPSYNERIQASVASRQQLIDTLQRVLDGADGSVSSEQIQRLEKRLSQLKSRNETPEQFLRMGQMLWQTWNGKRASVTASGW
ncbi:MAG TPA: hypothetical protein VGQ87_02085 [Patescibacteria group bacterium]|jgi:hypothetical protein|nr:hypothetical protein [Patescibacteria group bacterium]